MEIRSCERRTRANASGVQIAPTRPARTVHTDLPQPSATETLRDFVETIRRACNEFDDASATTNTRLGHVCHLSAAAKSTLEFAIEGSESSRGATDRIRECEAVVRHLESSNAAFVDQLAELSRSLLDRCERLDDALAETRSLVRIAREARILALNGRIEARRAGEAGRGFGVVAEGLHDLAEAAHRTRSQIEHSSLEQTEHLRSLSESIRELSEAASADRQGAGRRVEGLISELAKTGSELEGAILSGTMTSQEICEQLGQIVLENQRVDRGRQVILTACTAIENIVAACSVEADTSKITACIAAAREMVEHLERPVEDHEPELF